MINQIYSIMQKEFRVMFREKGLLGVLFVMPAVFVLILTAAGLGSQTTGQDARILLINHDSGAVSQRLVAQLRSDPELTVTTAGTNGASLDESAATKMLTKSGSAYSLILNIPEGFSSRMEAGASGSAPTVLRLVEDPAADIGRTNAVEHMVRADIVSAAGKTAQGSTGQLPNGTGAAAPPPVTFVQTTPKGTVVTRPIKSVEQNVPAYTIFGIFFIVQVVATSLLRERENGTFLRLDTAPVSRAALLIGKLIPYYLINMLQVLVLFAFGHYAFHLRLGSSPVSLALMTVATAAAANALGLSIASISKNQEQMGPMSALILIVCAACGGVFIPTFQMPHLMKTLSWLTPHAWAIRGFQDIIVRNYGFREIYIPALVLLAYAGLNYMIALKKFRFE